MATRTIANGGGNWSSTGTWVEGVVPTTADDVVATATSGGLTITTGAVCRSLDLTTYVATLSQGASVSISIGDASGGKLVIPAGCTYIPTSSATINMVATSDNAGAGWEVNTGGKTLPNLIFNGIGGKWRLNSALTVNNASTLTLTAGHLDTNGQTVSMGLFSSSNTNVRALTLGASSITATGTATVWDVGTSTNLTVNSGTSTITLSGSAPFFRNDSASAIVWGSIVFSNVTNNSGSINGNGAGGSYANITVTAGAVKIATLAINQNLTVTGTFTANGNSITNRLFIISSTSGTIRTITSAAVSLSNTDFQDINGAGTATWSGTSLGDGGNNTGITFTTPTTRFWVGNGGSWSDTARWSATSGGASGVSVPLCHDDVNLNSSSFSSSGQTCTWDMPRAGKNITIATSNAPTITISTPVSVFGNWSTTASPAYSTTANVLTFRGRGTHTITNSGVSYLFPVTVDAGIGSYTLQDDFNVGGNSINTTAFTLISGTFNANNKNLMIGIFNSSGTVTRTITMGSGNWNLMGGGATIWTHFNATALTINRDTATMYVRATSNATHTISGSTALLPTVIYTGGIGSTLALTTASNLTVDKLIVRPGEATNIRNGFVWLPGGTANYASTPDSLALSITGDIDIRAKIQPDSWANGALQAVVSKRGANTSYQLRLETGGRLGYVWSNDGTAVRFASSTVSTGFSDGQQKWIRVTHDVDNGAGGNTATFYTSNDGTVWTQLGSAVINTGATTIADTNQVVELGTSNTGAGFFYTGKIFYAEIRSGIDGTIVANPNFEIRSDGTTSFSDTASPVNTWTVNSSSAARTVTMTSGVTFNFRQECQLYGTRNNLLSVRGVTAASAAIINSSLGVRHSWYNVSVQDINGNGVVNAINAIDVSGNSNINFQTGLPNKLGAGGSGGGSTG